MTVVCTVRSCPAFPCKSLLLKITFCVVYVHALYLPPITIKYSYRFITRLHYDSHVCLGLSLLPWIVGLVQISCVGEQVSPVFQDVAIEVNYILTSADPFYGKFAIGIMSVVFVFNNRLSRSPIIEVEFD